jgi:hypothetical protein
MKTKNAKNIALNALTLAAAVLTSVTTAQATVKSLTDGNSTAWVDLDSSAGMYQWTVDGINHLNQQWFWVRAGSGPQMPINSISAASWSQSAANKLTTTYANASYSVEIMYTLTGAGSGTADIDEGIKLHNFGASPLSLSFYQYSDFNLLNTPGGDQVVMDNVSAYQWKGDSQVAEGIIAPSASAYEANTTGGAGSTLYKLDNTADLVLANVGYASGDVTWAFQWDFVIQPGADGIITKDKLLNIYVIPEPCAVALLGLGLAALVVRRQRLGA